MIEWGDAVEELFPGDRLVVRITSADGDERRFAVTADGVSWKERWETLEHSLQPWREEE